jgi:hypothetical protein
VALQKLLQTTNGAAGQVTQEDWKGFCQHVHWKTSTGKWNCISQDVKALSSTSALTLTVTVKMLAVWAALILVDIQTEEVLTSTGK